MFAINQETNLPSEISADADFRMLFPLQKRAQALPGDIYKFKDDSGHSILVKKTQHEFIIEQERNGKKYLFVPSHNLVKEYRFGVATPLESRYLVDQFSHWQSIDNPLELLLIERKSNQEKYLVQLTKTSKMYKYVTGVFVDKIIRLADQAILSQPSEVFTHFEASTYIQEWYDDKGNLLEIASPFFTFIQTLSRKH